MAARSKYTLLLGAAIATVCTAAWPAHSNGAATRAEYVAQAEPYCASANRDIAPLDRRYIRLRNKGDHQAAGAILRKGGMRLSTSVAQVRAIPPPPGDEQTITSWLDLIQQVAENNIRRGRVHAQENFKLDVRLFRRNNKLRQQAHALVAGFGFYACTGGR